MNSTHSNYDPHELRLANEIAYALDDLGSLTWHLQTIRTFREEKLREVLHKVMAMPPEKIKTTRARLYTFLITQCMRHGDLGH